MKVLSRRSLLKNCYNNIGKIDKKIIEIDTVNLVYNYKQLLERAAQKFTKIQNNYS